MKLKTYLKIKKINQAQFAREIQYNGKDALPQMVGDWASGRRDIPIYWMPVIEKATGGMVARNRMHKQWREIWPELNEQSPLIVPTAARCAKRSSKRVSK